MLDQIMIFYYIITITTWWPSTIYLYSTFISLLSLVPKMFMRIEVLDVVHRLKQHDKYLVVRFLALVITMVTKVGHGH